MPKRKKAPELTFQKIGTDEPVLQTPCCASTGSARMENIFLFNAHTVRPERVEG
jgi:hypothetical protein